MFVDAIVRFERQVKSSEITAILVGNQSWESAKDSFIIVLNKLIMWTVNKNKGYWISGNKSDSKRLSYLEFVIL